jgi:hypothetical protein
MRIQRFSAFLVLALSTPRQTVSEPGGFVRLESNALNPRRPRKAKNVHQVKANIAAQLSTKTMRHEVTPDGRYFAIRGRLWRTANPSLAEAERAGLVARLMAARRAYAPQRGRMTARRKPPRTRRLMTSRSASVLIRGGTMASPTLIGVGQETHPMPIGMPASLALLLEDDECRRLRSSTWTARSWTRWIFTRWHGTRPWFVSGMT